MLYKTRNTLVKKYILPFLRVAAITIKIKAETTTKLTEIATEITKTLAVIKYTNNLIVIVDLKDIATSIKKSIAVYGDI